MHGTGRHGTPDSRLCQIKPGPLGLG